MSSIRGEATGSRSVGTAAMRTMGRPGSPRASGVGPEVHPGPRGSTDGLHLRFSGVQPRSRQFEGSPFATLETLTKPLS